MLVQKELALSMAHLAAAAMELPSDAERTRAVSAAKVLVAKAGRFIGENAIQLHGGIGVTTELELGDYFKFVTAAGQLFGDSDHRTDVFVRTPAKGGEASAYA